MAESKSSSFSAAGGTLFGSLISGIFGLIGNAIQNKYNKKLMREEFANNLQAQREQNQWNAEQTEKQNKLANWQSEKAYQRSTAVNQVSQLQAAGMSKAGAINALNGAGSYTPAPVNATQGNTAQLDYSAAQSGNLFSGFANMAQVADMMAKIKLAKEEFENNKSIEREKLDLQRDEFEHSKSMDIREDNRKQFDNDYNRLSISMQNAATRVMQLVEAKDYDTPQAYIAALKGKAAENDIQYFNNADFVKTLQSYYMFNSSGEINTEKKRGLQIANDFAESANKLSIEFKQLENTKLRNDIEHDEVMHVLLQEKSRKEIQQTVQNMFLARNQQQYEQQVRYLESQFNMSMEDLLKNLELNMSDAWTDKINANGTASDNLESIRKLTLSTKKELYNSLKAAQKRMDDFEKNMDE